MRVVIIYGSFQEPTKRQNAITLRYPSGRVPWARAIAPAVDRLVRPWYNVPLAVGPGAGRINREKRWWQVDVLTDAAEEAAFWAAGRALARYEWTAEGGIVSRD